MFVSKYKSKIDDKGRTSVPAQFRPILEKQSNNSVFVFRSFLHQGLEAHTECTLNKINSMIEEMPMFSRKKDALATAILSRGEHIYLDSKGRMLISKNLMKEAGLFKEVLFVGKGKTFEIWQPDAFEEYYQKSLSLVEIFENEE